MSHQKRPEGNADGARDQAQAGGGRAQNPQLARERQEKAGRLAAALRENLKRRKQRARASSRDDGGGD